MGATAVVVAAGGARRMGAFKPLLPLGETTVIHRVLQTLQQAGVRDMVVVTGRQAGELEASLAGGPPCTFAHNPTFAETDMFTSVKIGLAAAPEREVFILPADIPLFTVDTCVSLLRKLRLEGAKAAIPRHLGKKGHPVLLSAAAAGAVKCYTGEGGLKGAMAALDVPPLLVGVADSGILYDMDHPEEYALVKFLLYARRERELQEHQWLVALLAVGLGQWLNQKGFALDLLRLERAALLHDMDRECPRHESVAAEKLREIGLLKEADIVADHMRPGWDAAAEIGERQVLFLADRMASGGQAVSVQTRYERRIAALQNPEALAAAKRNQALAMALLARVEALLGEPLCPEQLREEGRRAMLQNGQL